MIDAADAAGIGTVLGNNDGLWVVDITTDRKGNLPDQVAVEILDDGDSDWSAGRDIAALFYVENDRLSTNECAQPSAEQLESWSPPVGRAGEISSMLGGDWGGYRMVAFDAAGQPLAYGREPGRVMSVYPCDDPNVVAELVELEGGSHEVALRSLADFEVLDTAPADPSSDASNAELSCDGTTANQVVVTPMADDQFTDDGPASEWRAQAVTGLTLDEAVPTNPDTSPAPVTELTLAQPPTIGGWSPWLIFAGAAGGVAYVLRKAQDPEWRSSWNKPDNSRNAASGRRREDSTNRGHFKN